MTHIRVRRILPRTERIFLSVLKTFVLCLLLCSFTFFELQSQGATTMDVDDEEDLVPEITKAHFEEAMKFARRLLPHSDNYVNSSVYVS